MKRILCIVSAMNAGGAETFLMKIFRNIDRQKYQMDFCVNVKENFYSDEIDELGGKIYVVPCKSQKPIGSFMAIKNLVKEKKYRYVMRVNEHSLSVLDLVAAKLGGAETLIMRSSNASSDSTVKQILHKMFRFLPKYVPDIKIAPSKAAARYTFGRKSVEREDVFILPNALDISEYTYSEANRIKVRKAFDIEDKFLVGHVGRFSKQKNHEFLIDVFNEILKRNNKAVLLLVGTGELEKSIRDKVKRLGIEENVIFAGVRDDVNEILSGMDVMLFPSLFEGMPNVIIESQANGLLSVVSDDITEEIKLTDRVYRLSRERDVKDWARFILARERKHSSDRRESYGLIMQSQGYDIKRSSKLFTEIIFGE